MRNPRRWRTITTDAFTPPLPPSSIAKPPTVATVRASGFTQNTNSMRFFPQVETRDFTLSSHTTQPNRQLSTHNLNQIWLGKWGTSSKTMDHGPFTIDEQQTHLNGRFQVRKPLTLAFLF